MPEEMSLQELGRRIHENTLTLEQTLVEMKSGSCSVQLGWSEDDRDLWECSWIVGGKRFTSHSYDIRTAVLGAALLPYQERAIYAERSLTQAKEALEAITSRYCELANSGDCGSWDPEQVPDVINARRALAALSAKPK